MVRTEVGKARWLRGRPSEYWRMVPLITNSYQDPTYFYNGKQDDKSIGTIFLFYFYCLLINVHSERFYQSLETKRQVKVIILQKSSLTDPDPRSPKLKIRQ